MASSQNDDNSNEGIPAMLATAFATEEYTGAPRSLARVLDAKSPGRSPARAGRRLRSHCVGQRPRLPGRRSVSRPSIRSKPGMSASIGCLPDGRRQVIDFRVPRRLRRSWRGGPSHRKCSGIRTDAAAGLPCHRFPRFGAHQSGAEPCAYMKPSHRNCSPRVNCS